jgi:hypothetical protein
MRIKIIAFIVSTFISALVSLGLLFASFFVFNDVIDTTKRLSCFIILTGIIVSMIKEYKATGLGTILGGGITLLYILFIIA